MTDPPEHTRIQDFPADDHRHRFEEALKQVRTAARELDGELHPTLIDRAEEIASNLDDLTAAVNADAGMEGFVPASEQLQGGER